MRTSIEVVRDLSNCPDISEGDRAAMKWVLTQHANLTAERDQLGAENERLRLELCAAHEDSAMGAHSMANTTVDATARDEAAEKALGEAKKALEQIYWHHETIEAMEREAKDAIAAIATSAKGEN